jgi:hypothetical protein
MPATVIAGRIGWDRGLTVLKHRIAMTTQLRREAEIGGYEAAALYSVPFAPATRS